MKMRGVMLALAIAPLLGGCGIPDLVAHTVKTIEKRNEGAQTPSSSANSQTVSRPQAQTQPDEPPPPVSAPAPRRSSVSVEELPAR